MITTTSRNCPQTEALTGRTDVTTTTTDTLLDMLKIRLIESIISETEKRGLTQKELADVLDTTQPRVSNMFHFFTDKFSLDSLFKYAYALDIRVRVTL